MPPATGLNVVSAAGARQAGEDRAASRIAPFVGAVGCEDVKLFPLPQRVTDGVAHRVLGQQLQLPQAQSLMQPLERHA